MQDVKGFFSGDSDSSLTDITFSEEDIMQACGELKANSAAGADGVPAALLKNCRKELKRPLHLLWRSSLDCGSIPADLLLVLVSPIHKGGSRGAAKNYRPVALTSHIVKVFERVVRRSLVSHLERQGFLPDGQHGFRAMRSTLTQLLSYWDKMLDKLEVGGGVDAIYLDFAKAFDKVPHQRLVAKMMAHGITGKVVEWVEAWLTGREQRVVLNGKTSSWSSVDSGVPQGSVLGPTLFIIFINDIDSVIDTVNSIISKFADDTKVGRTVENEDDRAALQRDIDRLLVWSDRWQMQFNASKCKVLQVGAKNKHYSYTMGGFAPAGRVLDRSVEEKDIGVMVHESLKPGVQCAKAAKKANQVLGQMARGLHFRDKYTWIGFYRQYCRPHLETCIQAWSPWTKTDIDLLESVQQRAVKMCSGLKGKTYTERLKEVGLTTLEERRIRGDMIQVWKTLHKKDDVNPEMWFTPVNPAGAVTRVTSDKLNLVKPTNLNLDIRRKFWSVRSVEKWNSLPKELKSSSSVITF